MFDLFQNLKLVTASSKATAEFLGIKIGKFTLFSESVLLNIRLNCLIQEPNQWFISEFGWLFYGQPYFWLLKTWTLCLRYSCYQQVLHQKCPRINSFYKHNNQISVTTILITVNLTVLPIKDYRIKRLCPNQRTQIKTNIKINR